MEIAESEAIAEHFEHLAEHEAKMPRKGNRNYRVAEILQRRRDEKAKANQIDYLSKPDGIAHTQYLKEVFGDEQAGKGFSRHISISVPRAYGSAGAAFVRLQNEYRAMGVAISKRTAEACLSEYLAFLKQMRDEPSKGDDDKV